MITSLLNRVSKEKFAAGLILPMLGVFLTSGCMASSEPGGVPGKTKEPNGTALETKTNDMIVDEIEPVATPIEPVATPFETITPNHEKYDSAEPADADSIEITDGISEVKGNEIEPVLFSWNFEHVVIDEEPPATYRINDLQIGDLNGDGLPDVWTSGRGAGEGAYQMVWYKNPNWERNEIASGDYKYGILGDLDGDGDLDIVTGQDNDAKVYWFENTGEPEQRDWPRHDLGLSGKPDLFHVGDVNGDGRLDVIYKFKDEVGWAENTGDSSSAWPAHLIWSGETRTGGAVADIDQDGDLDIIYGNGWLENPLPDHDPRQEWLLRLIDPDWSTEAKGAAGDLDGDGHIDVVLSGEENDSGIAWYSAPADLNAESWVRQEVVNSGYEGVHSLELADFDQDGDLDIFAAEMHTGADPDKVTIFENVDIYANTWSEHILDIAGSHNARVGDLDGDDYPDIVGKNFEAGDIPLQIDVWMVRFSEPAGRWQRHIIDNERPWQAVFIDGGDINGDDLPDVITGGWWYQNPGHPGGEWTRHVVGGEMVNMAVVHDLDSDGDLDILGTTGKVESNDFLWAQNDGGGEFTLHTNLPAAEGDFLQGARVAQIIPGGNVEVVLSWHNRTSTQMFQIPTPATDAWSWEVVSPTTNGEQIAIGDIDDDGDLDIHLGTQWLRNDDGEWTTVDAFVLGDPEADPDRVEWADVNGDGREDVVIGAEHAQRVVWAEAPSDPNAPWTEHVISTDILGMSLDVADLDGDGDVDVVVGEHNTEEDPAKGRVIIYRNQAGGSSWDVDVIDFGLEHHDGTQLVDIDNDSDLDILSIGWINDKVVLYENLTVNGPIP